MTPMNTRDVLERLQRGEISLERAEQLLKMDFLENIGGHTIFDHAREARRGIPEIIFGEKKTPDVVAEIVTRVMADREVVLISRVTPEHLERLKRTELNGHLRYVPEARMIVVDRNPGRERRGKIGIMTAGSSDRGVAEEARTVAEAMGVEVLISYDVGVAALHRLLTPLHDMIDQGVDCLVVAAGMEGALPTVVSGLVDVPVIGVPTSVGYGHGGAGQAALMGMLQTCSPGLMVVNIDNGVAAGATAALISRRCNRTR